MASYIRKLKDSNGVWICPVMRAEGIYMSNNQTLAAYLNSMRSRIQSAIDRQ